MFEQIRAYLNASATAEQTELLMQCISELYEAGYQRVDFLLEQEMAVQETLNDGIAFQVAENILKPLYHKAINEFGVELSEETPLPLLSNCLGSLLTLDNWEDSDTILGIVEDDQSVEETLSEIIAEITMTLAEDYLVYIESVKPSLIERIAEQMSIRRMNQNNDTIDSEIHDRAKVRYLRFEEAYGPQEQIRALLGSGFKLGLPWDTVYTQTKNELHQLWESDLSRAVAYLFGLLLISELTIDQFDAVAKSVMTECSESTDISIRAMSQYSQLKETLTGGDE